MDWLKLVHPARRTISPEPFGPGDDVRVWYRIQEQGKERLGQFEGVVIRYRGAGVAKTFTVRRVTHGVGVERVFPVDAPVIDRVEVLRHGKVKRSRLYFLRHVVRTTRLQSATPRVSAAPAAPEVRSQRSNSISEIGSDDTGRADAVAAAPQDKPAQP